MNGQVLNRFRILLAEKEHRDRHKYSYRELQKITGLAASTLSAWGTNRTKRFDADTIGALCEFLECTPGDLLEYIPKN